LALPLVVMLLAQTAMMALFARFVIFNLMGRDYEAAVITAAGCGFGMGATPNAMANMNAIVARYGPAPKAYFIVPLVGSLFIDFINAFIIPFFLNIFKSALKKKIPPFGWYFLFCLFCFYLKPSSSLLKFACGIFSTFLIVLKPARPLACS